MNTDEIEKYVSTYLADATDQFLREIVDHGIHNTGANIIHVKTDAEFDTLSNEFHEQAASLLNTRHQ